MGSGLQEISDILSPVDFLIPHLPAVCPPMPPWVSGLYAQIQTELKRLPLPGDVDYAAD